MGLLVTLAWGALPVSPAHSLSCVPTYPIIGVVRNIETKESYIHVVLDKPQVFDDSNFENNEEYSIDSYEDLVTEYVRNGFQITQALDSSYSKSTDTISLSAESLEHSQLRRGDILVNGPPFHVCNYSFYGVFLADGTLKSAVVNDSYQDYSYRNSSLMVKAGRELECDSDERCSVAVNFTLNATPFTLSPGQVHVTANNPIKSVSLLDSSALKEGRDPTVIDDWGFDTYVTYVLHFLEPAQSPSSPDPIESLNFFQRMWRWFVHLF